MRKLLERSSNGDANSIQPIEEVARDLVQFIVPVRKLLSCKINKKSLNLLRLGIQKEFPKAEEATLDVFDNIFNQVFLGELYLMEAHGVLIHACKADDSDRHIVM